MRNIFDSVLFAVAREDHKIEASLIEKYGYTNLLTVCSGGCVPISLKKMFPNLDVVAYDINPYQIDHCKKKIEYAKKRDICALNIGEKDDRALNQSGKFEKMFQGLRELFITHITDLDSIKCFFDPNTTPETRKAILQSWNNHSNIEAPYREIFNDKTIEKIFSDQATKQGKPGTYIKYFQKKIMNAFQKQDSYKNPFLQHIFLGHYTSKNAFPYMNIDNKTTIKFFEGNICDISNIETFNLVSLSNLFDWSNDQFIFQCVEKLSLLKRGSAVLLRQLNNHCDWLSVFKEKFMEDKSFDLFWQKHDRSMFYDHFRLFIKK